MVRNVRMREKGSETSRGRLTNCQHWWGDSNSRDDLLLKLKMLKLNYAAAILFQPVFV